MAHDLDQNRVRVHHSLHGYSEGHRLLASSTSLKTRDQKTMLIMSDVSGANGVIGAEGYLTGYPLTDSGMYAFARTWAATEMPRPGCVWTHTLLLDFADLAVLPTMNFLVEAFRRPSVGLEVAEYELPLDIEDKRYVPSTKLLDDEYLKRLLWALYEHPKERIIAPSVEPCLQSVLLLWAQQWPRLRRSFRFCTLAFGDRSTDGNIFDLQFIPPRERSIRSRFSGLTDAERLRPSAADWMEVALLDLVMNSDGRLRRFLREVGGDLAGGREAFVPLCRLYNLLPQFGDRHASIDEAVVLLDKSFDAASARSLRAIFVSAIAKHPAAMSEEALAFAVSHLNVLDPETLERSSVAIGRALWARDPERLVQLLEELSPRRAVAENALLSLSSEELIHGLQSTPNSIPAVISQRPELTAERDLWLIAGPWWHAAMTAAIASNRVDDALLAVLAARRDDLAGYAVQTFGSARILLSLCRWASASSLTTNTQTMVAWLAASVLDRGAVGTILSDCQPSERTLLSLIARATDPGFVLNAVGEDPWWTSVRMAKGKLDDAGRQYLAAYLFARALGNESRNQAELIGFAFDDVYIPALHSRLSMDAWRVLEPRLPHSWLFDWDFCQRIRDGLVQAFVDRELSAAVFVGITQDEQVFRKLAETVGRTGQGRRFLGKALEYVQSSGKWTHRAAILDEIIW